MADKEVKAGWLEGLGDLTILRQVGLMVGVAASVAIGIGIVMWSKEPEMRVLYADVAYSEANAIIEQLDANQIKHRFDATGRTILVPKSDLMTARLRLASEGITGQSTVGFELLDEKQTMGTSQFMESARYRRALEGELARTITGMKQVSAARVHLAMPKDSSFVRDARKPSASVFIDVRSGSSLESAQVTAISSMVASSIPEMSMEDVTVVDQNGRLLSDSIHDESIVMASKQLSYTREIEQTLLNRVNSILEPVVGQGNYRASVSVDVDFTEVETAEELFSSEPPVVRSEQNLVEEKGMLDDPRGVPGALSNTPPADGRAPEIAEFGNAPVNGSGNRSTREQNVRNYEVDRSVSYTKQASGEVTRMSVAVVVEEAEGEEGESRAWSEEELAQIEVLVRNAVGIKDERGDAVSVVNAAFYRAPQEEGDPLQFYQQDWFWDLMKHATGLIAILVLLLGVLRPMLKSLATRTEPEPLTADDLMLDLSNIDDGMRPRNFEEQMDEVKTLVAEDPAKVAQAVRQWVIEND